MGDVPHLSDQDFGLPAGPIRAVRGLTGLGQWAKLQGGGNTSSLLGFIPPSGTKLEAHIEQDATDLFYWDDDYVFYFERTALDQSTNERFQVTSQVRGYQVVSAIKVSGVIADGLGIGYEDHGYQGNVYMGLEKVFSREESGTTWTVVEQDIVDGLSGSNFTIHPPTPAKNGIFILVEEGFFGTQKQWIVRIDEDKSIVATAVWTAGVDPQDEKVSSFVGLDQDTVVAGGQRGSFPAIIPYIKTYRIGTPGIAANLDGYAVTGAVRMPIPPPIYVRAINEKGEFMAKELSDSFSGPNWRWRLLDIDLNDITPGWFNSLHEKTDIYGNIIQHQAIAMRGDTLSIRGDAMYDLNSGDKIYDLAREVIPTRHMQETIVITVESILPATRTTSIGIYYSGSDSSDFVSIFLAETALAIDRYPTEEEGFKELHSQGVLHSQTDLIGDGQFVWAEFVIEYPTPVHQQIFDDHPEHNPATTIYDSPVNALAIPPHYFTPDPPAPEHPLEDMTSCATIRS